MSSAARLRGALGNGLAVASGALGFFLFREFYIAGGRCRSSARLDGKTVVITGSNAGIGKETAYEVSERGARVVLACRDLAAAEQAAKQIREKTKGDVSVVHLDLSSLRSVRDCAQSLSASEKSVDVLINNAGVMACDRSVTAEGFERQIGVNHFGHFLLTNLLMDKLRSSAHARVVNVASEAHRRGVVDLADLNYERRPYSRFGAYCQSKLANVLFTRELAKRLEGTHVTTYAVHPGVIATGLWQHLPVPAPALRALRLLAAPFTKTTNEGAQTSVFCAVEQDLAQQTGDYYADCRREEPSARAQDAATARELWSLSERLTGISISSTPTEQSLESNAETERTMTATDADFSEAGASSPAQETDNGSLLEAGVRHLTQRGKS